ncbi:hypothetical protein VTN02DRAFT_607 [Thermoascus thermophilus]
MDHHAMHHAGMDMDHGHMGHGGMDHGDMGGQCKMNMLFTWSFQDLCIVFRQWRVTGPFSLVLSLVAIILLAAGYEGVREATRRYEAAHAQRLKAYSAPVINSRDDEIADESATPTAPVMGSNSDGTGTGAGAPPPPPPPSYDHVHHHVHGYGYGPTDGANSLVVGWDSKRTVEHRGKIVLAALYGLQVFYSFFIMLLFMTYNGAVMIAVAVGAALGYLAFGGSTASKTVACH